MTNLHPAIKIGAKFKSEDGNREYEIVYISPSGIYPVLAVYFLDWTHEPFSQWFTNNGHEDTHKTSGNNLDLPEVFDPTKPCWTNAGEPVRILCTDRKHEHYPILTLTNDGYVLSHTADGRTHFNGDGTGPDDLTNTPPDKFND